MQSDTYGATHVQFIPNSDNTAEILIKSDIGFNPVEELIPGFSILKIKGEDADGNLVINQSCIVKHAYKLDDDYQGYSAPYILNVIGIDGRALNKISDFNDPGSLIYIEYEYNVFTTRTYTSTRSGGNTRLYMDFNAFHPIEEFDGNGYYYDHGIVNDEYSIKILNTGVWKGGVGTIITLEDSNDELYRVDTLFRASQLTFDEDYAIQHIGTHTQNWQNYREIVWDKFCGNSWNTLDFSESLWCNFNLKLGAGTDSTGTIKFNEEPSFAFKNLIGVSEALNYGQAVQELNQVNNSGLSRFYYELVSMLEDGIRTIQVGMNTKDDPSSLYLYSGDITVDDVLYGEMFKDAALVENLDGVPPEGYMSKINLIINVNPSIPYIIPKKGYFTADCGIKNGDTRILTNVKGLSTLQLNVGDYISTESAGDAANVIDLKIIDGKIREIYLETSPFEAGKNISFIIEWVVNVTPQTPGIFIPVISTNNYEGGISINAYAKNPSIDNLAYLSATGTTGTTGTIVFRNPADLSYNNNGHSYPVNNFYSWLNTNKIGAFENGIQESLIN